MTKIEKEDLRPYRPGRLTILQLMIVLSMLGVGATILLHYVFSA